MTVIDGTECHGELGGGLRSLPSNAAFGETVTAPAGCQETQMPARLGSGGVLSCEQLTCPGRCQAPLAVKGSTTAHDGNAVPQARPYGGLGQPPKPAYPYLPATLRTLALAHAAQIWPVTWRQGTKTGKNNPDASRLVAEAGTDIS